jgi:ATP-dependent DNA helicase RecG
MTLHSNIADSFRITPIQKVALHKLKLSTIRDLLYYFPVRYGDTAEARSIDSLQHGDTAVIYGKVSGLKTSKGFRTHIAMADGYVEDETGRIHCVWFNQPYVAKMYSDGMLVRIEGKISQRRTKPKQNTVSHPFGESSSSPRNLSQGGIVEDLSPQADARSTSSGELYFSNPKIETVDKLPTGVGDSLFGDDSEKHTLYPVYPESRGITTLWLYHTIQKIFKSGILEDLEEPIPEDILKKYNLPGIKTALIWIHTPLKKDDALSARKRFAFEEIFIIQLGKQQARKRYENEPAFKIETELGNVQEFVRRFPFRSTAAQDHAIESILSDMGREYPMSRLLEGDVGSGKTAVAAATAYAVMVAHKNAKEKSLLRSSVSLQVAYMCPTEILATQHFESFIKYFSYLPIQIALITGSGCKKFPSKVNPKGWTDISRAQLLKWVSDGSISVVIGTHALIQKSVVFKNLAYVIIDEQHRFGTSQRAKLVKKNPATIHEDGNQVPPKRTPSSSALDAARSPSSSLSPKAVSGQLGSRPSNPLPHLLSMTATPIPRTLALTMYGDLDLTILDQSPEGRKQIITELVLPNGRETVYEKIRLELQTGRQMYVICPRIDEPDPDKEAAVIAKSVKEEAKRLKEKIFPEYEIGVLHGKMTPKDKDETMSRFNDGTIQILCATSVVEVGVNVTNATIIIIEGAERFGLAQLHQLRGRVMRSTHQSYCYVFTETNSAKSINRLKALQSAKNGFELAELDLSQRGAGQLSGTKQWGISDIAMEALQNLKMVEAARTEAVRLIGEDTDLRDYPILKRAVHTRAQESHFE